MFSFAPLSRALPEWPQNLLPKDNNAFEEIGFTDFGIVQDDAEFETSGKIAWLKEIEFPLPALDSISLVLFGGAGMTEIGFTYRRRPDFEVRLANLNAALRLQTDLLHRVHEEGGKWVRSLGQNGEPLPVDIVVSGAEVAVLADWDLAVVAPSISMPAVELGNTGIVLKISEIQLYLSEKQTPSAGPQEGFKGVAIKSAQLHLSGGWKGKFVPKKDVELAELLIGSSGFSGHIKASWEYIYNKSSKTFSGDGSGKLFGIPFGLESLELELKQNRFQKSEIKGELLLPFFDEPVKADIGIDVDGGFSVGITSTGQNGLYKLTKENVLEMELDSIGFEIDDGLFTAKLSGQITPLFGKDQGLKWPSFQVDELSIDSKGHVHLDGGWLNLREQYSLDFHGFQIGITKIGFGKTDDGGKWIGLSGELKLVDGFTAGASVEGLRITWYDNKSKPTRITLNGVGVEFEIPEVVRFKGAISYRELEVTTPSGSTELVHRFDGDIKLELISLKLEIDAKLVIGSASGPQGTYTFFAIYLGVELPAGIPLGSTPLALYGMAGLFALRMEPDRHQDEEWYEGWYKRPDIGVTDLKAKWINRRGSLALGGGVTLGTVSDNGFTFACKALLIIVFPGPIVLIEGKANLLKERAKLDEDPLFRSLTVIDNRKKEILIGLDAQYKQDESGAVIDIQAGTEAYFAGLNNWHIYVGEKEPREKRIRADIFKLFQANSYFMLDPVMLQTGAWVGYARQWKFGPLSLTLEAWLEGNAKVNWRPLHFHGDLWMHGSVEAGIFGFEIGLSVDARFEADVFEPFHVLASFEVSVKLPKPLKSKSVEITLEWGPKKKWPEQLPLPLQEVAIEHFKVTTSWPLPRASNPMLLLPNYDDDADGMRKLNFAPSVWNEPADSELPVVPLDCRPHLSFGRAVHDDALIGVNPQQVQPAYERIGDPSLGQGPVRVRYALTEIELHKRNGATWELVAGKSNNTAKTYARELFGSWAPMPQLPLGDGAMPVANTKLWLWSITPFDYTRHGGSEWDDAFTGDKNFAGYPCPPQSLPYRKVCCNFERLDRGQALTSSWKIPDHPEFTLTWLGPQPQKATALEPPVNGYTRALCFPARTLVKPPLGRPKLVRNVVTISFTTSAKWVGLVVGEGKQPEKTCLSFRNRGDNRIGVNLPLTEQGVTIQFTAFPPTVPSPQTTQVSPWPTSAGVIGGLECKAAALITLPCSATSVELTLTSLVPRLEIVAQSSTGGSTTKLWQNPMNQPGVIRFEGNDLKQLKITPKEIVAGSNNPFFLLHEICFLCPDTTPNVMATALNKDGKQISQVTSQAGKIEINGEGVTHVQLTGKNEICLMEICALLAPDPAEVTQLEQIKQHLKDELARWKDVGEILEPNTTYRLAISTKVAADGEGELSGESYNLDQVEFAYFRTGGPPGLTQLSAPIGRDADNFESGLDDLTRYVRQTIPATVPAPGQKPVMAKPFYRAYDVSVDFNEDYVDLMYRVSRRDLGLYLYDNNNRPVRDVEGRLLAQSGDWRRVETVTLTKGEERWMNLVNAPPDKKPCVLPLLSESSAAKDSKLLSAVAGRVLEPDTVYEARLIPLLLHEDFRDYALAVPVPVTPGKLGNWQVRDEGQANAPSKWQVLEAGSRYLTQTSGIKGTSNDAGTILWYADNPTLAASDQPSQWTDYRFSVYLRSSSKGAMGVIFRRRSDQDYYRFSMDRQRKFRQLVRVANGTHQLLKNDNFIYQPNQNYLLTVEAIGETLRVYQDGALVFELTDNTHKQGSIGLYCFDNPGARFADVRVDDFRQTAKQVYRFQFTTSFFANFRHHLHSYQDETWAGEMSNNPGIIPALGRAVPPTTPPSDGEARAYETLATAVLGQAARQNPREVQVTRIELEGIPQAWLVQSPEPLDWSRIEFTCWRGGLLLPTPSLPGKVKLTGAKLAANQTTLDSVTLLLREAANLTGCRIESRVVMWPIVPVIPLGQFGAGAQTTAAKPVSASAWTTFFTFGDGKKLPAGSSLQLALSGTGTQSQSSLSLGFPGGKPGPVPLTTPSVEVRVVAPDGAVLHARHFLPESYYALQDVAVLRKADGTGFFVAARKGKSGSQPLQPGQYRLHFVFRRENAAQSPVYSEAGDKQNEVAWLDIPWQTH